MTNTNSSKAAKQLLNLPVSVMVTSPLRQPWLSSRNVISSKFDCISEMFKDTVPASSNVSKNTNKSLAYFSNLRMLTNRDENVPRAVACWLASVARCGTSVAPCSGLYDVAERQGQNQVGRDPEDENNAM